jgi:hypothetical protein
MSDHVIFRTKKRPNGDVGVQVHTPESVVEIDSREELEAQLKHYAQLLMKRHTGDTMFERRKYVELIRPALRYYCRKFGREIPRWLADDDYYRKHMSPEERTKHFGTKPLRIGEFQKVKKIPNATAHIKGDHDTGGEDAGA